MRRSLTSVFATGILSVGFFSAMPLNRGIAAVAEISVLQADREFVQAAAKGDSASVAKLLEAGFTWTDAEGKTFSRAEVLPALPKPALGDEAGAHQVRQTRSQVEAIMADRDKVHVLRVAAPGDDLAGPETTSGAPSFVPAAPGHPSPVR